VPPDPPLNPLALDLLTRATVRQLADVADELAALAHPIRIHPLPPGRRSRERRVLALLRAERRRSKRLLELLSE
jgi:hypothetical protein